jgi:hypothetical protein
LAADLVALGWSQRLAPVVRGVLEQCRRPVLLVPVEDPVSRRSARQDEGSRSGSPELVPARPASGG